MDAPNFRGETPLHVAAKNECKDLAELLMKLGNNVNFKDYQQQTPLNVVAWSGCQGMAKVLIQSGRDVNAEQRLELTPFLLAGLAEHKEIGEVLIIIITIRIQNALKLNLLENFFFTNVPKKILGLIK